VRRPRRRPRSCPGRRRVEAAQRVPDDQEALREPAQLLVVASPAVREAVQPAGRQRLAVGDEVADVGCRQAIPLVDRRRLWPSLTQVTSAWTAPSAAPWSTSSSVRPGKKFSRISRPRACSPWDCQLCGTPRRGAEPFDRVSRSTSVTRSKVSVSTRAVNNPARLARARPRASRSLPFHPLRSVERGADAAPPRHVGGSGSGPTWSVRRVRRPAEAPPAGDLRR
jgi:hypothetical protein